MATIAFLLTKGENGDDGGVKPSRAHRIDCDWSGPPQGTGVGRYPTERQLEWRYPMNAQRLSKIVWMVVILLVITTGLSQAQAPRPAVSTAAPDAALTAITPVMSYQGRLMESGSPASGTKSMTFRLYTAPSGGTRVWEEGPKSVTVTNGLFNVVLGDVTSLDASQFNQELWLEVVVGTTTLPRQKLMGAPYAFSLAPGARVTGSKPSASLLEFNNTGAGAGLQVRSAGSGIASGRPGWK